MAELKYRKIRSFVRRPGRTTTAQRRALETLLPRFGIATTDSVLDLPTSFGRAAPVILEIGFGDGEALFTSAVNNPGLNHLGIEVHEPGVGHLLILLERAGLNNVRLIARDAVEVLDDQINTGAIAAVRLFFPDPWPKKRHHKRRIVQPAFIDKLTRVLEPGGLVHFATDWAPYAEHIETVMSQYQGFTALSPQEAATDSLSARPPTKFEQRGRRLGHEVRDLYHRVS
jgi:tRNA (guanine-N7-)-methyltransferase